MRAVAGPGLRVFRVRLGRGVLCCALFGLAPAGCGGGEEVLRDAPHVLLISLDSTRRDLLSAYGHEPRHAPGRPTSPSIDALAAQGVLFEEAYSTSSWTLPSHWSIMTGEPELVHAVDLDHHRPSDSSVPVAERLKQAGYRTAGFFSGPYLEPQFGFGRGFDRYEACYGAPLQSASKAAAVQREEFDLAVRSGVRNRMLRARRAMGEAEGRLGDESHRDISSEVVASRVIEEFERAAEGDQPLFVFAHFFDPHFDHVAPEPFGSQFDPDYSGPSDWSDFMRNPALSVVDPNGPNGERHQVADARALENVWAGYEGELAWTDAAVGRMLERLEELGLAQDTLVVLLADHGDELFEHQGLGHRRTLFEEVVAVPMIMRWPEGLPSGVRVPGTTSTLQVAPTILDLVGFPQPSGARARTPWGSLVERIDAAAGRSDGGEALPGTPVLGRFVRLVPARLTLRDAQGQATEEVDVRQIRLTETWHEGDLKLLRRANWIEPLARVPPANATRVRAQRGREVRSEEVLWIDLKENPSEPMDGYSADFSDPRASAALEHFQGVYGELLAQRRRASVMAAEALSSQLDALGYGGSAQESAGDAFGSEALALPAPRLERVDGR